MGLIARRMQREVVVLPQPDSPTRERVSPVVDLEGDVVDGFDLAGDAADQALADGKVLAQIADVEDRRGHAETLAPSVV